MMRAGLLAIIAALGACAPAPPVFSPAPAPAVALQPPPEARHSNALSIGFYADDLLQRGHLTWEQWANSYSRNFDTPDMPEHLRAWARTAREVSEGVIRGGMTTEQGLDLFRAFTAVVVIPNETPEALTTAGGVGVASPGIVSVGGYWRRDGTYVAPHVRTSANSTQLDNFSTRGNYNPYRGTFGTRAARR